ncbi:hypothetical protein GCM10023321_77620 [Pseudonocardia eucalypti]|uniref:Uncharacterized protein n=1 Tax=Pseudonocardia eucalypti TaxID=648755 RepID=A0ABP9RCP0_9PSEU|nr:hypothetical protein [Pseudonocardia eucalypti]
MSATVDEVADAAHVAPGDILVLLATYPDEVTDLWEESGVLSKVGIDEVHDVLDPGLCSEGAEGYQHYNGQD